MIIDYVQSKSVRTLNLPLINNYTKTLIILPSETFYLKKIVIPERAESIHTRTSFVTSFELRDFCKNKGQ